MDKNDIIILKGDVTQMVMNGVQLTQGTRID